MEILTLSTQNTLYLISYDIKNNQRRTKIANILLNYGERVQYSVFEAWLNHQNINDIINEVLPLLDLSSDSFRVYSLCKTCQNKRLMFGKQIITNDDDIIIV